MMVNPDMDRYTKTFIYGDYSEKHKATTKWKP